MHTKKLQVVVEKSTRRIVCVAEDSGKPHDFKLYKDSIGTHVLDSVRILGDSAYQGIKDYHPNSETPKKKPKNGEPTKEEKAENRRISKKRIVVENINAKINVSKSCRASTETAGHAMACAPI